METSTNMQPNMRKKTQPPPSDQRRKVLLIFPYDYQKSPRSVREIRLLKENNYDPVVISTELRYVVYNKYASLPSSPNVELSHDFPVYRLPFFLSPLVLPKSTIFSKIFLAVFYFASTILYSFWLFFLALALCVANQICVIHAHNTPDLPGIVACLVSKLTRIPYIYEVHDLAPVLYAEDMNLPQDSPIPKFLSSLERIAVSNSEGNIFVSETMKSIFVAEHTLSLSKCAVVYSSWNRSFPPKYSEEELERLTEENSLDSKFVVLYLGSMEEWSRRGLDILIESMNHLVNSRKLTNILLVLVGDGSGMRTLVRLTHRYRLGKHVLFTGELPRFEAYKWLTVANVAIDPLRRAASTDIAVSNKVLEYMAAQKTIVASDLAGHREVLRDGYSGLLFKSDDPIDLAKKVCFLANNAGDRRVKTLGINARKDFCEKYSWENEQQKILDLYDDLSKTVLQTRVG